MRLTLQTRWKVAGRHLVYFGLPAKPGSFRRRRRISKRCRALLSALDGTPTSFPGPSGGWCGTEF